MKDKSRDTIIDGPFDDKEDAIESMESFFTKKEIRLAVLSYIEEDGYLGD